MNFIGFILIPGLVVMDYHESCKDKCSTINSPIPYLSVMICVGLTLFSIDLYGLVTVGENIDSFNKKLREQSEKLDRQMQQLIICDNC